MVNKVDECASDEWCAGAENVDEGLDTIDYKSLCIKGQIISNIVRSLWLLCDTKYLLQTYLINR